MNTKNNPFNVEKPEDSSGFLLWQVTNLWQREIKKALDPLNLTHSQFVLMASIYWFILHKQEITQIALSQHTKIDSMTTSTVLRTLQKKEFIKRKEHLTDTRCKTVELTEKGIEITKQAIIIVEKFDNHFFSILNNKITEFNQNMYILLNNK